MGFAFILIHMKQIVDVVRANFILNCWMSGLTMLMMLEDFDGALRCILQMMSFIWWCWVCLLAFTACLNSLQQIKTATVHTEWQPVKIDDDGKNPVKTVMMELFQIQTVNLVNESNVRYVLWWWWWWYLKHLPKYLKKKQLYIDKLNRYWCMFNITIFYV